MKKINSTRLFMRMLTLTAITALASCAEFEQVLQRGSVTTRPPLTYYAWLESADSEMLEQERQRLAEQAGKRQPEINLIQRALLYSVPAGSEDRNPDAAMELLTVALQDTSNTKQPDTLRGEYTAFARIWLTLLKQQQEYQWAQANQNSDKHLIQELSVKVDRLEQQIEALTTIEQRLIKREQTQGKP